MYQHVICSKNHIYSNSMTSEYGDKADSVILSIISKLHTWWMCSNGWNIQYSNNVSVTKSVEGMCLHNSDFFFDESSCCIFFTCPVVAWMSMLHAQLSNWSGMWVKCRLRYFAWYISFLMAPELMYDTKHLGLCSYGCAHSRYDCHSFIFLLHVTHALKLWLFLSCIIKRQLPLIALQTRCVWSSGTYKMSVLVNFKFGLNPERNVPPLEK